MKANALSARIRAYGSIVVELMIAVAVVIVLAMISLPSYAEHVRRGARAEMQAFMVEVLVRQQHRFALRGEYAATIADLGLALPQSLTGKYAVTMSAPANAPPRFTVSAAPRGPQATDDCGTLVLNGIGPRSPAQCWR